MREPDDRAVRETRSDRVDLKVMSTTLLMRARRGAQTREASVRVSNFSVDGSEMIEQHHPWQDVGTDARSVIDGLLESPLARWTCGFLRQTTLLG